MPVLAATVSSAAAASGAGDVEAEPVVAVVAHAELAAGGPVLWGEEADDGPVEPSS
jgi:hypothetical protein